MEKYKMFQTTNQFRLDGHMIDMYMTWQHLRWDMAWKMLSWVLATAWAPEVRGQDPVNP